MSVIKSVLCVPLSHPYGVFSRFGKRCGAALGTVTLAFGLSVAAAGAEPFRLVALGDSLTQGYGLPADDGFVPQLQDWLQAQGHDVIVINAGVSGDTTAGGLARLDWTLAEPVDAMLVILGGNDLLRGIDPAASRANLDAILARLQQDSIPVMLAGMPAPGNYGPEFRDAFDAMYTDLAQEYDVPLVPNFMQPMTEKADAGASFADLMQGDHIHPNADGVALIVDSIGPQIATFVETVATTTP
ncbi:arylesterase [Roseinatronobacter alkalisoli]|uniref:Arylesterase n=1 Tax=Roseinatronobacter alkalisoli TaxID=3028235 RepID=A0ABT5T4Y9_9RHOB|nr:arylesterase [Roseinatronobacter sp. HJB301]MDD7970056.1 arylesterase [Roseinatronobacter sp. HJB301]